MTLRPPTPEQAIESVVHRVVSLERDAVVSELLRLRIPSHVLSRFWGGGARLKHMKNRALARGLARGVAGDCVIRGLVRDALARHAFQSSLSIRIAGKRWAPDGGALPESALRWLAERAQPLVDDIVFWSVSEERSLPGSIPGRAAELERLGGHSLPVPVADTNGAPGSRWRGPGRDDPPVCDAAVVVRGRARSGSSGAGRDGRGDTGHGRAHGHERRRAGRNRVCARRRPRASRRPGPRAVAARAHPARGGERDPRDGRPPAGGPRRDSRRS